MTQTEAVPVTPPLAAVTVKLLPTVVAVNRPDELIVPPPLTFFPDRGEGLVTIYGNKFTGATAVSFGGTAATNFTFVNDTLIVATKPALTAGSKDVTVTTPGGTSPTAGTENDFVVT